MLTDDFVSDQEMDDRMDEMQDWMIDNPDANPSDCTNIAKTTTKQNQFIDNTGSANNV